MEPDGGFLLMMGIVGIVAMMVMGGFGFSVSFRSFNFSFRFG